ncbi:DNA replication terminus site-binding protein (plasmid) [Pseudoalteromonas espejiana]
MKKLKVNKLTGELAHKAILNSFTDIYKKDSLSDAFLKRHPGILVIKSKRYSAY